MRSLGLEHDRLEIIERVRRLRPGLAHRWGRMSAHQMLCHLCDSFRGPMGSRHLSTGKMFGPQRLVKWIALNTPFPWPHGVKTRPEVDQEIGGTKPVEFAHDRRMLEALIDQFAARSGEDFQPHPMFGRLTTGEWHRWGWLHTDHHLRQFDV